MGSWNLRQEMLLKPLACIPNKTGLFSPQRAVKKESPLDTGNIVFLKPADFYLCNIEALQISAENCTGRVGGSELLETLQWLLCLNII